MRSVRAQNRVRVAAVGAASLVIVMAAMCTVATSPLYAAELQLGPASLSIRGQESLTFRQERVSGGDVNQRAYRWDNFALSGGFEHRTDLVVHGELLPDLRVDASFARGPYYPSRQRLTFTYDGADAVVKLGDLAVAFDGTRLACFQRSLRGIQVESKLARGALTIVASESKPSVRTDTIYGRNSSGPYYLAATPIVDASEAVMVDGRPMRRGADYSIDYQIGLLQFAPTLIIPPTSQITISYEYDSPGAAAGTLVGLRGAWPFGRGLSLGATYLTLERRGTGAATSAAREDRWLGNNSAGPFVLSYRPIEPGSERLRLDGILQVEGRDYRIDCSNGSIFFLEPVPAGVSIVVSYRVVTTVQSAARDRSLVGLDAHYADGGHVALDAEIAQSGGGTATSSGAGAALALAARGDWDRFTLGANLRSSGGGFAPFESVGYERTRSGYDWQIGFAPMTGLRLSAGMRDYRRPYSYDGDASGLLVRDSSRQFSLDFTHAGWPSLSYVGSWSMLDGAGGQPLREDTGSQLLTVGYSGGAYGATATYRRSSHARQGEAPVFPDSGSIYGPSPFDAGALAQAYAGSGSGTSLSLWYRPGTALSVACDLARSGTSLQGGGSSDASNTRVAVEYAPAASTTISLGYRASSTGETVSADGCAVTGYSSRSQLINMRHSFAPNLSLNLAYDTQMSQGRYGTNSDSNSWSGGFWWQPSGDLALTGQYTRQKLAYLGASGRSSNDIMSLGATVGPFGPGVKLELSYSGMCGAASGSFGGSGGYGAYPAADTYSSYAEYAGADIRGMANSSVRARLSYALTGRQEAFAEWETSSNSGYPGGSKRQALGLGWQIGLGQGLNFTLDWRRISSESADARYSYRAQTMSGQLGLKF